MEDLSRIGSSEDALAETARSLGRANQQMDSMRSSLSMLTTASAGLAEALQKRNQEYDALLALHNTSTRRIEALQAELSLANAERANYRDQVNERNAQLVDLHTRLDGLERDLAAERVANEPLETQLAEAKTGLEQNGATMAELDAKIADLQVQLDEALAAKADAEAKLQASAAELAGLQQQVTGWQAELDALVPAEETPASTGEPETTAPEAAAAVQEAAPQATAPPETTEAAEAPKERKGLELAAVAAAFERHKQLRVQLDEANAKIADLQAQLDAMGTIKSEQETQQQVETGAPAGLQSELDAANARIGELEGQTADLNARIADLQTQLQDAAAGKAEADARLQASEADLADLDQKLTSWQADLQTVLPAPQMEAIAATAGAAEVAVKTGGNGADQGAETTPAAAVTGEAEADAGEQVVEPKKGGAA